jgi:hypothetical protein
MSILHLMLMIAGMALGLWLVQPNLREQPPEMGQLGSLTLLLGTAILGGVSLVGPLLLLGRREGPWGAGRLLWFATGTAAWLLWPPVIYRRARGGDFDDSMSGMCFAYGTPLMALYVTAALLAGGWLRKNRRRRLARRSWHESFGLLLGLAWACLGGYVLIMFWGDELRR